MSGAKDIHKDKNNNNRNDNYECSSWNSTLLHYEAVKATTSYIAWHIEMSARFLTHLLGVFFYTNKDIYIFRSRDANSVYIVSLRIEIDIICYIDCVQ